MAWWMVPGNVPTFAIFSMCIPIYSAVVTGRMWVAAVFAGWYGVSTFTILDRSSEGLWESASTLGLVAIALGASWLIGLVISRYVRGLDDAKKVHKAESQLLRSEMARDLHDTVAASMTRIVMRVEAAKLRGDLPDSVMDDLEYILETGRQGSYDLRALLIALRDSDQTVASTPLWNIDSLQQVVQERGAELEAAGFAVEMAVDVDDERLPASIRNTMGKVVVEATSNILKYAKPASTVTILLEQEDAHIEALFLNRVGSRRSRTERHLGLVGIRERLTALGGDLENHQAGNTWVLSARLPLKGNNEWRTTDTRSDS